MRNWLPAVLFAAQLAGGCKVLAPGDRASTPAARIARVQACYEAELALHPLAQGKVTAYLTITASGSVAEVAMARYPDTTYDDQSFETCLTKEIRTWTFPGPDGGGSKLVTFKWDFKRSDR
jgi:hypothetical protein